VASGGAIDFETSSSPRTICTALVERSGERAELYVPLALLFSLVFVALLLLISSMVSAQVFDSDQVFSPWAKVVSVESAITVAGRAVHGVSYCPCDYHTWRPHAVFLNERQKARSTSFGNATGDDASSAIHEAYGRRTDCFNHAVERGR
jgi:hypothetical protein